jgi:hypothetical protein
MGNSLSCYNNSEQAEALHYLQTGLLLSILVCQVISMQRVFRAQVKLSCTIETAEVVKSLSGIISIGRAKLRFQVA